MNKNPPAFKPECQICTLQSDGECRALSSTAWLRWTDEECKFLSTRERLKRDLEIRKKAIKEGRVKPHQYG